MARKDSRKSDGEWIEPHTAVSQDTDAKIFVVQLEAQAQPERYDITQIKPSLDPEPAASNFMTTAHSALRKYASIPTSSDCFMTEVMKESDSRA